MDNYLPVCVFEDSIKNPITSAIGKTKAFGTNARDTFLVEISGASSATIYAEGCLRYRDDDTEEKLPKDQLSWNRLAIIDAKSFEILDSIKKDGFYYINTAGLKLIRLDIDALSTSDGVKITGTGVF